MVLNHSGSAEGEEVRRNMVSLWFPGLTGLDADSPCDSGSHLGSGRVYLKPWLLGLARFWHVDRVGHLSFRDSIRGRERFQTSGES